MTATTARVAALAFATLITAPVAAGGAAAGHPEGFKTAKPAYLVPLEPGVIVDPILSTGDIVGTYQMSGIPDGLGAYKDGHRTMQVLMNHELDRTFPVAPNPGVDSRISKVTIDRESREVLAAEYLFTGLENFARFCSSTLEVIEGRPWYFTGEESSTSGHRGSSIAMRADTGEWQETRQFGMMLHENVVPMERLSKMTFITTDDDFTPRGAYLYAYIANGAKLEDALSDNGDLYVWKADPSADFDTDPSTNDIEKGETIPGRFVPIPDAAAQSTPEATKLAAETAGGPPGGFRFVRLEDAAADQNEPGVFYFVDTGRLGSESRRGRMYRMEMDPSDPTIASLELVLDGEIDDMTNPDNIDTSPHSVVIQEDRNSEHRDPPERTGYGRILVYDIKSGTIRAVARPLVTADTVPPRNGEWESSGVINAQTLLGDDWWLVDVQAHGRVERQPGPSLVPDTAVGEDGQLLAIFIPDS